MSKHPLQWIFFVLISFLSTTASAQADRDRVIYESDTVYHIQFIALKDSTQAFNNLTDLGSVSQSYSAPHDLFRYSLGPYQTKLVANATLFYVRQRGFPDAFIKIIFQRRILNITTSPYSPAPDPEPISATIIAPDVMEEGVEKSIVLEPTSTTLTDTQETIAVQDDPQISIIYTGKSYGVLGTVRSQVEHELITEYASEQDLKFKLVSHASWKAKGVTIILPSDEPEGDELDSILLKRNNWELVEDVVALKTDHVLLFQDPNKMELDLFEIFNNSPRLYKEFPEVEEVNIKLYRTFIQDDVECLIIEEPDAIWPLKNTHWTVGEFNRVDVEKTSRLFELPVNKGSFGVRKTVMKTIESNYQDSAIDAVKVDMGNRNADFNLSNYQRSMLDINGLRALGYSIIVPYEQEFLLGVDQITQLKRFNSGLTWLASNVISKEDDGLFSVVHTVEKGAIKIGFLGLVSPSLKANLPGQILSQFEFVDIHQSAQAMVDSLTRLEVDVIVALSNLSSTENVELAEQIQGIDIILSDISGGANHIGSTNVISIDPNKKRGLAAPYYTAAIDDYGRSLGELIMTFQDKVPQEHYQLQSITDREYPINDRTISDENLMDRLTADVTFNIVEKGELLVPAFVDLIEQEPSLEDFDETTKNGRMSKVLWEKFVAKVLAKGAPAEIAIVRKVQHFLPLIGKLHEREVRSWLWLEDDIVLLDMKGRDIKRLLLADTEDQLVTSGLSGSKYAGMAYYQVMGRPMLDDVYYRVATTNVISNGVLKEYFRWGLRKADKFIVNEKGELKYEKNAPSVALRDYVIEELKRIRSLGKGKDHHRRFAKLLLPVTPYEKLFSFNFIRPTLWTSLNRAYKGEGYEAIPESRIISGNSFVIGVEGGIVSSLDTERSSWSLGLNFAFAEQSADVGDGVTQTTENADDINLNVSYHFKGKRREALHPYTRMEYDTEFTSTLNRTTGLENPKQRILRNVVGVSKGRTAKWPILELGASAENDFSNSNYQFGLQGRSLGRFPLNRSWNVIYSLTNNFNYYLPNKNDTERDLSFKYNMIHEIQVPLFGDISLSMAADLFFFQGKTEINRDPGMSMLMKVGITYNRLWKPRFQPLF